MTERERIEASAQAAYETYTRIEHGAVYVVWEDLHWESRENWIRVVRSARRAYEDGSDEQ